jgi:hypothetical protein
LALVSRFRVLSADGASPDRLARKREAIMDCWRNSIRRVSTTRE